MTELTSRQREIIWNAIHLIDEKGIQGLTIKNLSQSMEFTEAAIYRHFKSKADILAAIIELFKNQTSKVIEEKKQSKDRSLAILESTLNNYSQTFTETPAIVSVIFAEEIFQNESALKNRLTEIIDANEQFFQEIIRRGQRAGEIRNDIDPALVATNILGTFRLTVKKWKLHGFQYSLVNETRRLTAYFQTVLS
ncbi:MAG: TetR/AcrR family transcriptional regulator [Bacteroidales bacterium]|nr:TetR/AcrR family transcriptional regulator [Bacteroidales bacterium]